MEGSSKDELFEITDRNYQKLSENLEKEGYREGKSDGSDSMFQKSFDAGYEDGFKIGFVLGRRKDDKAKMGRCELCRNKELMSRSESDIRGIAQEIFDKEQTSVLQVSR